MKHFLSFLPYIATASLLVGCATSEVEWDASGTFEATEIIVSAEENGKIEQLNLVDGEQLLAGQIVGKIDTVQLYLQKEQLIASRSAASARRQDLAKQIAATEQQIQWQRDEMKRFTKLVAQNAATQKQVDDIANQISVLDKQLIAQRSTIEKANQGVTDDSRAMEIQIDQIDDRLKKCRIVSPIDGTVLVRYAEQGEFTGVGKPLFSLANLNQIYLRAYITANLLTQMKIGQQVSVYSDFGAKEQRKYEGIVEWISSRAEFTPKTVQTRDERANLVYAVKIAVQNDGYLKIGMYGQMKISNE
ncbi:MAG: HlyD family efflux transporter periplasmic adaptor subunit [Mucinivorans sp.]